MTNTTNNTNLLTTLMAPRWNDTPVTPGTKVTYTMFGGGSVTVSVKSSTMNLKGRPGFSGLVLGSNGKPVKDETTGKRSKAWGYISQITKIEA